jgi:hypothetical protein
MLAARLLATERLARPALTTAGVATLAAGPARSFYRP